MNAATCAAEGGVPCQVAHPLKYIIKSPIRDNVNKRMKQNTKVQAVRLKFLSIWFVVIVLTTQIVQSKSNSEHDVKRRSIAGKPAQTARSNNYKVDTEGRGPESEQGRQ